MTVRALQTFNFEPINCDSCRFSIFFAPEYYQESLIHMLLIHFNLINPNGTVSFDQFICCRILSVRKLGMPVISYTFKFSIDFSFQKMCIPHFSMFSPSLLLEIIFIIIIIIIIILPTLPYIKKKEK